MDDELDRILAREDDIVPSSGFAGGVMEAVRREASAPPALPFPWKRALPGLAAWVVALGALLAALGAASNADVAAAPIPRALLASFDWATTADAGWVALALLISFIAVKLSLRLAGGGR